MPKDRSERRTYRKSPGRQYGYDYDPLHSHSGQGESAGSRSGTIGRSSTQLAQRPDPRRTRQLLRQNILANKGRPMEDEDEQPVEEQDFEQHVPIQEEYEERQPQRPRGRSRAAQPPHVPTTRELMEAGEEREAQWQEFDQDIDPDIGYEDPLDVRMGVYPETAAPRPSLQPPLQPPSAQRNGIHRVPTRVPGRSMRPTPPDYDDDEYEDEDEDDQPRRPRKKKKNMSRRGMLVGLGAVAIGGAGIAAYELGPKLPQAVGNVGANIEHQLQDAFNKGVQQGADTVRREFITSLDSLEGFTLDGAMQAARLTRVAYDTFVSPIITIGANITGNFLTGILQALRTARGFLAQGNQDNDTLAALQKVLETWVTQVANMPKQLNSITQTDLDGAQGYLRELQRKLAAEKAKLNGSPTPTPNAPNTTPTVKPK